VEAGTQAPSQRPAPVTLPLTTPLAAATNAQNIVVAHEQPDLTINGLVSMDGNAGGIQIRPAATPSFFQPPQVPLNMVAVHIAQQAQNGAKRFDIRLDPPELGRLEIRLDFARDGQVTTHIVVERSETLDLLQRDARSLERALQNAGLDTSEGNLKFSLKDQGTAQDSPGKNEGKTAANSAGDTDVPDADIDYTMLPGNYHIAADGLDIRI
jgi:flagellar hook-length control protein FliK